MSLALVSASRDLAAAAREFNAKLQAGGVSEFSLPIVHERNASGDPRRLAFYVVDGTSVVGGAELVGLQAKVGEQSVPVMNIQAPMTLGMIDKSHSAVATWMMRALLAQYPLMFAVGMGGAEKAFPRLLRAMRWTLRDVPFRFRVLRGGPVARQLPALHTNRGRSQAVRLAAKMGAPQAAVALTNLAVELRHLGGASATEVHDFDEDVSTLWHRCRDRYEFAVERDASSLRLSYPESPRDRVTRVRVDRRGRLAGWCTIQQREMRGSSYFGDLRVGTLLDVVALERDVTAVVHAAVRALRMREVDLVVANFSDPIVLRALRAQAFVAAPSNYLVATSPLLEKAMIEATGLRRSTPAQRDATPTLHVTRADGDGRIHL